MGAGTLGRMLILMPSELRAGLDVPGDLEVQTWDPGQPMPARVADVDFFVPPYTSSPADLALMDHMPALRVVQTLTAGVDNVVGLLPPGVALCNAAGVHDASTAELAVGLTIASLRRIDEFARAMPTGMWSYARHESLADRRVVVVGFGSIGRAIARRLDGFECEVIAVARRARVVDGRSVHATSELPELLPGADVVILIVPLSPATTRLVDADFLGRMKQGALLVNVARGQVVDTDALLAACASGRVRAALDVTDPEPLPPDHPLWRTPGVLISPHVGGNTSAFLPRARRLVEAQLERHRSGQPLVNVVVAGGSRG
jgi:phosphoglycerate dehydrogenase-like enzyme